MDDVKRENSTPAGLALRKLRESKNMTQYEVAKRSGKQIADVWRLESVTLEPTLTSIKWFAKALGMKPWTICREVYLAMEAEEKRIKKKSRAK